MLARGAVVDPFLARRIRATGANPDPGAGNRKNERDDEWRELCPVIAGFRDQVMLKVKPGHAAGRIKQWLNLLRRRYAQAELVYQRIRPLTAMSAINEVFAAAGVVAATGSVA
jgi:tRNA-dihydrouridine synthase C